MKYEDVNLLVRLWYRIRRKPLTPMEIARLEEKRPMLTKKFRREFYWGILIGVAFVVFIAGFELWPYFAACFITLMIITNLIPFHRIK